ncbi:MAG: CRISPR-associated endonuclease Cas1 [Lachnospiraceae bacterium]|nr:CRISPR-associated endonuclease Cas1 [Lachnospiraceae bacterium]
MAVIYVKEQGALIQKSGERIIISKGSNTLLEAPIIQIDNIALIGNVQITTQALHMLMEKGIDVSYFSYSGKYLGHAAAEASKNIFLRFQQYGFYLDEKKRLDMAKNIVRNKIQNQMSIIRGHRWENGEHDWKSDLLQMEKYQKTLQDKASPNEVLGVEGICSNIYFGAFGHMLKCDFQFHGRNRRPPKDPVNVMISLAYTFLTKEMCNALDAESFKTYLGFLHGIRYGRKSLALDMIEEFRQPMIDRFVLLLFNKHMIGKYDFEFPDEGGVVLNEDGFRKFCTEYERWLNGRNSASGENSFRIRIREQVARLKRAICKNEEYKPYCWEERNVCSKL